MKKKHAKQLKEIASRMGPKEYVSYEWIPISGEDMLLCGHKIFKGQPIQKDRMYEMKFPVFHTESFEKELKRIFNKGRDNDVLEVIKKEHRRRFPEKK